MDGRDHPRRHVVAAVTTVVDSPGAATSPVDEGADGAVVAGDDRTSAPGRPAFPSMGYQPSLDGLRALSVGVVLLYHAGFSWMHGGFFGVEVFFVVSGFLITSLLIDEHDRNDHIAFGKFWNRRARRLFPALYAVLLFVGVWAALAGTAEQQSQLRRDTVWSIFYVNNWGQILGDVPYFAGEVPLLRHLWSLAVEEQWYLIWPLLFVALMRLRLSRRVVGGIVVGAAFAVFVYMFWMQSRAPTPLGGPPAILDGVDRTNYLYLSTITRSGGLLLGAGAAFVWRPWRWKHAVDAPAGRLLDPLGAAAVAAIGCAAAVASITAGYVYQWLLPLVSILSLVAVMVAVHPSSVGFRRIMSWTPLVEVGKRSYGLYLWSWPIFVIVGATTGSVSAFVWAMLLTVVVAEASYRFLESPVRKGIVGRWWSDRASITYWPIAGGAMLVGALVLFYVNVDQFSRFEGGDEAVFELDTRDRSTSSQPDRRAQRGHGWVCRCSDHGARGHDSDRARHVGTAGDRRRLTGQRAGDQSARWDRHRLPERRQRQRRRVQRVRLGFGHERGEVRQQLLDLRRMAAGVGAGGRRHRCSARRRRRVGRVRRRRRRHHLRLRNPGRRCTVRRPTSSRASTRCSPRAPMWACSKWPACAPRTSRAPAFLRSPNAVTMPAWPT